MKREFIRNTSMLETHKYLRRINATLIRMIPKRQPNGAEAYVVLYIGG